MTLYEFNQAGYMALPKMTRAEKERARLDIEGLLKQYPGDYFLLLNNDLHYYTIFTWASPIKKKDEEVKMSKEILDIADGLGTLKSIEVSESGEAIEFWIARDGECHMYILFNYDAGVIKV